MLNTLLNQRFRIEAELGQGGMGTVYRAQDTVLDRKVAVKLLNAAGLGTEGRARLLHEARAAAQLNHPNIVSVYDAGETDGQAFIVMELVEGQSLFAQSLLPVERVVTLAQQICAALDHAHTHSIIHRDLKLENVLLTPEGVVKLTDFGLARSLDARLSLESRFMGTAFYLAPEIALGQPIDARVDLYALGVLLYELTTGRLPFTADDPVSIISQHLYAPVVPPRAHVPALPAALDALIVALLSKRPEDRPATARAVQEALANLTPTPLAVAPLASPTLNVLDRIVRGRLVGREREWAEVHTHWQRAAGGEAHVLLISGEPGIGKTRLLRELMTLAEVSHASVLMGECYSEGGAPYAPIADMVHRVPLEMLRALPPFVIADLINLAPMLRLRFPETPPNPTLDPATEQQRLFESFVALLHALAAHAPLLVVVDDAHWGDSGTLFLMRHLARRARAAKLRLLIVLTYREMELDSACCLDDVLHDLNRERLAARLKLTRLNRADTDLLVRTMLDEALGADFLTDLYHETEGNPFFIEEVCKTLIEDGQLRFADGHWQPPARGELQIPQSVRITIQARLSKLPLPAQEALRVAAILGREFEFNVLLHATEQNEEVLIEALETATRAQLIAEVRARPHGAAEAFAFAHALIPATLREGVSGPRRQRLHRRAAAALERWRPDDLEALAHHWARAGDDERAAQAYRRAGQRAQAVFANQEALRFYAEALGHLPDAHAERFALFAARANINNLIADRPAQRADVDALMALAHTDPRQRCEALIARADWELGAAMFEAKGAAQEAVALARSLGDAHLEARALWRLGWGQHFQGEEQAAKAALQAASERFRAVGDAREAAACLNRLALVLTSGLGERALAQQVAEEAVALSRQAGDRQQEAISLRRLAIVFGTQKRYAEQWALVQQALPVARAIGDRNEECLALVNLGVVLAFLNRLEESEPYLWQAKELAHQIGMALTVNHAVNALIRLHFLRRGEYEAALQLVNTEIAAAEAAQAEALRHLLLGQRISVAVELGQYAAVRADLQAFTHYVRDHFGTAFYSSILAQRAYMCALQGLWDEAGPFAAEAVALMRANGTRADVAWREMVQALVIGLESEALNDVARLQASYAQAQQAMGVLRELEPEEDWVQALGVSVHLALQVDTPEAALALSTEVVALLEQNPYFNAPEKSWFDHAAALHRAGQTEAAQVYGRRAYARVMDIAARLPDETLRASWLTTYFNREIVRVWGT